MMIKAKKEVKVVKENEKKEETNLKEAFVLWKHEAKSGVEYLSGNTPEKVSLMGFFNTKKKNPKQPDLRIYTLDEEGKQDEEVCSLWEKTAKSGNKYLSGATNEKENIVAFYNDIDGNEKLPFVRAYYKD